MTRTLGFSRNMCLWLWTLLFLFRSRSRRGLLGRRSRRGRSSRSLLRGRSSRRCCGCRLLLLCLLLATHDGEHKGHHEAKNKRCYLLHYRHLLSSHFYPGRVSLPFDGYEQQVGGPLHENTDEDSLPMGEKSRTTAMRCQVSIIIPCERLLFAALQGGLQWNSRLSPPVSLTPRGPYQPTPSSMRQAKPPRFIHHATPFTGPGAWWLSDPPSA